MSQSSSHYSDALRSFYALKNQALSYGLEPWQVYVGGSMARTLLGLDYSFQPYSDIDVYLFSDKRLALRGHIYGHRIACQYIPLYFLEKLVYNYPIPRSYPVIDLDMNRKYIKDLTEIFIMVIDDERSHRLI